MATFSQHPRRSAVQLQDAPLDILDFRIHAEIQGDYIRHTYLETSCSPDGQSVQIEELWKRESTLGQGSYGTIYLERCRNHSAKLRAVKEIKKCARRGQRSDHRRELEAAVGFSRPQYSHCFVRSDGWFEDEHSVFIIMEFLELGDLQRYLDHPLSEYETREITKQVLEGLTYMHENGFIHRDLKPENILVVAQSPDWHVKIGDFGISKQQQNEDRRHTLEQGTLGFAAPEQLGIGEDAGPYNCAVDMWSLGAVAYRIFTGTNAFQGFSELNKYVAGKLPFPIGSLKNQHMSATGLDFILKLMSPILKSRPSAIDAYRHRWFTRTNLPNEPLGSSSAESNNARLKEPGVHPDDISVASALWSDCIPTKPATKLSPREKHKDKPQRPSISTESTALRESAKSAMRETRIDDKWAPSALPVSRSVPVRHKAEPRTSKSTAKDSGFFEADAGLEESKEMYDREEPDSTSALRKSQSEGTISKKPPALRKSVSSQGQLERHGNYRSSSASLRLKQSQQQLDPIFESRQHTTAPSTPISRPRSPLLPQAPLAVSRQSSSKLLQSVERLGDEQQDEKELVKVPSRLLLEIVEHLQNHEQRQETELRRQPSHLCNNAEPNEEEEQYESEEQPEGKQLNSDGQWGQRELALRLASRLLKTNEQIERERQLKRRKEPESQAQLRERESAYRSPLFLSESEEKAAQRLEGLVASEEKRDQWLSHLLAEEMRFMSRRRAQWVLQKFESEELLRDDFAGEKKRAKWLLWLLEGKGQDLDVERNMNGEERKDMAVVGKCLHHYFKEERERERKQAAMTNDEEQQRHDRRELGRRSSNQTVEEQETRRPTRSNSLRELSDRQRKPHRSKSTETYHHRSSREALRHDEGPSDAFDSQQTETYYPKSYAPGSTSVSMRRPSLELEYKRTGKITKTPPPTEGWIQPPNTTSRHILTRKKSFPSHRDATTQHREYYSHSPPPPPPSDLLSSVESTIKSLVLPPDPPRGR